MPKLSYFNKASVMVYNAGDYTHELTAEGGQKIVLQPKQWNKFVFAPDLGNESDTQLHFSITNWKAGDVQSDENLVLYFDDFRYEFDADLTVDKNTAINVETALGLDVEGWDYKDVSVTGPSFTANSLNFTPTTAGDYTVSFKARRGEYAYDTFTVTVTVADTQKVLYDFEEDDIPIFINVFYANGLTNNSFSYSTEVVNENGGNRSLRIERNAWIQLSMYNINPTDYSTLSFDLYVEGDGVSWITPPQGTQQTLTTDTWLHFDVDVSSVNESTTFYLIVNAQTNFTAFYLDNIILTK